MDQGEAAPQAGQHLPPLVIWRSLPIPMQGMENTEPPGPSPSPHTGNKARYPSQEADIDTIPSLT